MKLVSAFFQKIVDLICLLGMFFFAEKTSKHSMLEDDVGIFFSFFFRCFFFVAFSILVGIFVKMGPERFGGGLKD